MRLLIVEDNGRLSTLIAEALKRRGFSCDQAGSLMAAEAAISVTEYSVIILDLGLPDGDGLEWLAIQSKKKQLPPTLILTARGGLSDRVTGLDAGADDYLIKPIEVDEIAARVRALLRRPGQRTLPVVKAGRLTFDSAARSASFDSIPLDLSRREVGLFELLVRRAGTVVPRSQIEETLYSFNEPVSPNAVEAAVSRLRRKLEACGGDDLLHTVRGVGYLLREDGR